MELGSISSPAGNAAGQSGGAGHNEDGGESDSDSGSDGGKGKGKRQRKHHKHKHKRGKHKHGHSHRKDKEKDKAAAIRAKARARAVAARAAAARARFAPVTVHSNAENWARFGAYRHALDSFWKAHGYFRAVDGVVSQCKTLSRIAETHLHQIFTQVRPSLLLSC